MAQTQGPDFAVVAHHFSALNDQIQRLPDLQHGDNQAGALTQLQQDVGVVKVDVNQLQQDVGLVKADIQQLTGQQLGQRIDQVKVDVNQLQQDVGLVKADVQQLIGQQLGQRIDQVLDAVQGLQQTVQRFDDNALCRTLNSQAGPNDLLRWPTFPGGNVPIDPPPTRNALLHALAPQVDQLLLQYGVNLAAGQSLMHRKQALLAHLGKLL